MALKRFLDRLTKPVEELDRVACPWLIRRFIDAQARILYVDPEFVLPVANETGAIPFDIEGVERMMEPVSDRFHEGFLAGPAMKKPSIP